MLNLYVLSAATETMILLVLLIRWFTRQKTAMRYLIRLFARMHAAAAPLLALCGVLLSHVRSGGGYFLSQRARERSNRFVPSKGAAVWIKSVSMPLTCSVGRPTVILASFAIPLLLALVTSVGCGVKRTDTVAQIPPGVSQVAPSTHK